MCVGGGVTVSVCVCGGGMCVCACVRACVRVCVCECSRFAESGIRINFNVKENKVLVRHILIYICIYSALRLIHHIYIS